METLLLLTYTAIAVAIFKIFKLPLNKWTVPTAALGGVVLVGALVFAMNYNHPHSKNGAIGFVTTPITPNVRGLVIEIPAKANVPVKKGDVLFKLNPTPYQAVVDQKKEALNAARSMVGQLEKAIEQQKGAVAEAKSEVERTLQSYQRYKKAGGGVSQIEVENRRQLWVQAQAALQQSEAGLAQAILERDNQKHNVVGKLEAELRDAQFDLDSTVVRAPTDGYPTQVLLRPGMMAVPFPLRPTMIFVNKPSESSRQVIAGYRQNALQRLNPGNKAEIIFPAMPGRVVNGKVAKVLPALAEGELQANGTMVTAEKFDKMGLVPVVIEITDDIEKFQVPDGAAASVSVYSEHAHHVAIIRKFLLRMKSWENYVYLDH